MKQFGILILLFAVLLFGIKMEVVAEETGEQMLLETQNKTNVYESRNKESRVVETLEKGTAVICTQTDSGEWYEIIYKEVTGYVQAADLGVYQAAEEADKEFQVIQEETEQLYKDVHEIQQQKKSDSIWIGVMAVLIMMMFATGIYTVIRNNRKSLADKER